MLFWANNNVSLRIDCEVYAETKWHQKVYHDKGNGSTYHSHWVHERVFARYWLYYMPKSAKWKRKTMWLNACTHVNLTVKAIALCSDADEFFHGFPLYTIITSTLWHMIFLYKFFSLLPNRMIFPKTKSCLSVVLVSIVRMENSVMGEINSITVMHTPNDNNTELTPS